MHAQHAIVLMLVVAAFSPGGPCRAQTPCAGQTCPGTLVCDQTCTVYCQEQLLDALLCYAQNPSTSCSHIVIPEGTTLNLCDTIELTSPDHDDLHLTIEGTLKWFGDTSNSTCFAPAMIRISGAQGIIIDGAGPGDRLITSNFVACQVWQPAPGSTLPCHPQVCTSPSGAPVRITNAFVLQSAANNITIENLNFNHIASMLECPTGSQVHTIHLNNLNAQNLVGYGAFVDGDQMILIDNCHVQNAHGQHGFRFYVDDVTILNSLTQNVGGAGFWIVVGDDFKVDGFTSTGNRSIVGPNHVLGSTNERVQSVDVRNVTFFQTGNVLMQVNLGTIGAWFDDITNQISNTLGAGPVHPDFERPER